MQTEKNLSRENIHLLFNEVSSTYDKLNTILSFGIDKYWRKKIGSLVDRKASLSLLDLATGTGDQIFSLLNQRKNIEKAIGIDLAEKMLLIAEQKRQKKALSNKISFCRASALEIPFEESLFDVVTMSFGIRNVTNMDTCFKEIKRVLKTGGKGYILEFSLPQNNIFKAFYLFYLRKILPFIGKLFSKHSKAYIYLNETIETFPYGKAFCKKLEENGFINIKAAPLTFGIVHLYSFEKPS